MVLYVINDDKIQINITKPIVVLTEINDTFTGKNYESSNSKCIVGNDKKSIKWLYEKNK